MALLSGRPQAINLRLVVNHDFLGRPKVPVEEAIVNIPFGVK
jgi:hypothetical protein